MEVAGGDGRGVDGTRDGSEGGVVVMGRDTVSGFEMDELRDILIAIKGIEELVASGIRKHEERTCGHRFGWVPDKEINLRVILNKAVVFCLANPLRQFYRC